MAFRHAEFGLDVSNVPMDVLVPNTGNSAVLDPGDVSESELDMEWSGGLAKDAQVLFVYTGDGNSDGFFDAMAYAIEQRVAPIVSVSYGTCEAGLTPSDAILLRRAGGPRGHERRHRARRGGRHRRGRLRQPAGGLGERGALRRLSGVDPRPSLRSAARSSASKRRPTRPTGAATSAALQYIPEVAWNQTFATGSDGIGAAAAGTA